ncbi:uncharacterized protein LOC130662371 isoform X2 [Hydractinia symbiolongicarpus]|uniref:uncharacterized protein LOC130662371 isoform X2 n=1 Tax=Hydractinia symbiolongicarpus TaxID=13093 RepID=UPI00254A3C34|nr:uncharacterized protein LOC130662371 isoform X2 [Hydractinia symbiolongicarpus]
MYNFNFFSLCFFVLLTPSSQFLILPSILWDPRNYLFACDNLAVKVGLNDQINFICPHLSLNTKSPQSNTNNVPKEKIYLLEDKSMYEACNATGSDVQDILTCNSANFHSLNEQYFNNKVPGERVFTEGKTYYYISTSGGTLATLNGKTGGSCAGRGGNFFPLKLAVYVCGQKEIDDGTCKRCQTSSCYENGCAKWNNWTKTAEFTWNGKACLQKYTRVCPSEYFKCEGDNVKYEEVGRNNCTFYSYCPSTSLIQPTSSFTCPKQTISETVSVRTVTIFQTTVQVVPTTRLSVSTVVTVSTSVSVSVSISVSTSIRTTTTTSVSTSTVMSTVTETKCSVTGKPPTAIPIRAEDISYDEKFYITVISAIIGALLVGIFVSHAIVSYCKGKYSKTRVIEVAESRPSSSLLETASTSKDITTYQNTKL